MITSEPSNQTGLICGPMFFHKRLLVVGGDFFDIVQPDGGRMVSIVGDVSDKGISAALYAAYTQSMFQSFSQTGVLEDDNAESYKLYVGIGGCFCSEK